MCYGSLFRCLKCNLGIYNEGRIYLFERCINFRTIHFFSKMNCYTKNFFRNCSLIAPSRLSDCVYLLVLCTLMIYSLLRILTVGFFSSAFFKHKYENFLVTQGILATFGRAFSSGSIFPASANQMGAFSSASLQLCTSAAQLQQISVQWEVRRSDPKY